MSDLVKRLNDRLVKNSQDESHWPDYLCREAAARIEALEAALKPFADESIGTQSWPDNERPVWEAGENIACKFTLGDLRHAASLLEPKT